MRPFTVLVLFVGCAGQVVDVPDAGTPVDAGARVDGGLSADAGMPPDAGSFDAGTADAGTVDAGASMDSGGPVIVSDAGLPPWVPTTLYEALRVPFTNRLDDVDLVGVWSGDSAAHFGSYSGGVYASAWGALGAHVIHGGGHAANNDNSVFLADFNDLTFKRVGGPTQLATVAAYNAAITSAPDTVSNPREYAPNEPGSAHTYDCLVYLPPSVSGEARGSLLRPVAGAIGAEPSRDTGVSHAFGLSSLSWTRWSTNFASSWVAGGGCAYDRTRGRIWPITSENLSVTPSLNTATRTWTNILPAHPSLGTNGYVDTVLSVHHEQRDLIVISTCRDGGGAGQSFFWFAAGSQGSTRNAVSFSTGTLPDGRFGGASLMWIPETQQLLYWTRQDQDALYQIDVPSMPSAPWSWTRRSITGGGRPSLMPSYTSSVYRRMDYAPQLKSVVAVLARGVNTFEFGNTVIAIRVVP